MIEKVEVNTENGMTIITKPFRDKFVGEIPLDKIEFLISISDVKPQFILFTRSGADFELLEKQLEEILDKLKEIQKENNKGGEQ